MRRGLRKYACQARTYLELQASQQALSVILSYVFEFALTGSYFIRSSVPEYAITFPQYNIFHWNYSVPSSSAKIA
jgi:hypothetical protein